MTHAEIMEKLEAIFNEIFDDDISLSDSTTGADVEAWTLSSYGVDCYRGGAFGDPLLSG